MTGSGTTFTSSSITVAAGSILVAVACGVNAAAASVTFTDSVNGSTGWSTAKNVANNPLLLSMGWRYFSAGQTVTVTATYNTTVSQRGLKLLEITGAVTPGALDGTPAGQFQGSVGTGADVITSGSLTTAAQPAMVVGACMNYGNNKNPAAGTGFTSTRVDWSTDVAGCRLEYQRVTATGTQAATYTGPSIDSWITIAIAFDEATAAAPVLSRHRSAQWLDDEPPLPRRRRKAISVRESAGFPDIVTGLKLWLRGDLGVTLSGGNVVAWADQSGNGNDVTGSIPLNASSINGKPGLTFSAAGMTNSASNILAGNSPRTIFAVVRQTSSTSNSVITIRLGTLKADYFLPLLNPFGGLIYTDGVNPPNNALVSPQPSVTNVPSIAMWQSAGPGAALVYKQNGVSYAVSQPSGSSTDNGTTGFTIGGSGSAFAAFVGDIDEVIVLDHVATPGEEAAVQDYLAVRYAIDTVGFTLKPRRPWAWQEPEPWQSARRALLVPTAPVVTADTVLARQDAAAALSWWDAVEAPATRRVRLVPIAAAPTADQVPVRPDSLSLAWEQETWQLQRRPRLVQQAIVAADAVLCRPDTWISVLWWEAPAPDVIKRRRVLFPGTAPVNTQVVRPPLVAKVDDAELAVVSTQLGNVLAADSIDMAIAGDT